ncbi:MerC domain-containing protein [Hankyongella ginsenosidimutans]|uniref:MerC domain-containing protein n=1 Tax=Hankyongella ginsenosidimutans TaxID=1763828 RepID=A0A4D7CAG8_9SPHN|nr:MerC domain-containing protein [Hankyongella ginsenosidimutans]QCI80343.1 MerC domain-containing protein [Hankyongella ginsenosidimutans]
MHRLGMGLSALCLIHCIALPWLLASLPVVVLATLPEAVRHNEWLHAALILPVVLVSGPVLLRAKPGKARVLLVLVALALLFVGLFVEVEALEQIITITGAMLLLLGHWAAMRNHRHSG